MDGLSNPAAPAPAVPAAGEEGSAEKSEEPAAIESKEPDGGEEAEEIEESEETEAPAPVEIKDDMIVKVGDQDMSIADLKGGFLRLTDYRRKTTELATERNAIKAERAGFAQEREQWSGYLKSLFNDHKFLAEELEQYSDNTIMALVDEKADELIRLNAMDDDQKKNYMDIKRRERELKRRERAQATEDRKRQASEGKTRLDAVAARYTRVVPAAMKSAGLIIDGDIEHNKEMVRLLQGELVLSHGNTEYTDEQIQEAAREIAGKSVAKALLREKKGLPTGVDDLIKTLGPDKVREILKREAAKSPVKRPPNELNVSIGNNGKNSKNNQKPVVTAAEFFGNLRGR